MNLPGGVKLAHAGHKIGKGDAMGNQCAGGDDDVRPQRDIDRVALEFIEREVRANGRKLQYLVKRPVQTAGFKIIE